MLFFSSNNYFHLHMIKKFKYLVFSINTEADTKNNWPTVPSQIDSNPQSITILFF